MQPLVKDPIYLQLHKALREEIRSGKLGPGERFLTEREISATFGVSRATANKAMSSLVAEGILEFRKGIGTFIRPDVLGYDLQSLVSFTDKARAAGKEPTTEVLRFETLPAEAAGEDVGNALQLDASAEVHAIERLRLADAAAVILERRWVVASLCPDLTERDLSGSLYALWTGRYQLDIAGADETIRAVNISGSDAELLGVTDGSAGLLVSSVGCLADGRPLWWERTLYRGDAYEFHNRLGPIQSARPATGAFRDLKRNPD